MTEQNTQILLPGGEWLPSLLAAFKVAGLELSTSNPRCYRYTLEKRALPVVFDVARSREVTDILAESQCSASAGLSGTDVFAENGVKADWILPLFKLVPSAPQALLYLGLTPNYQGDENSLNLEGSTIFTTYPTITRTYLEKNNLGNTTIIERGGKIEGLWRTDDQNLAIVDISSSGTTAQANDIRIVREIMRPEVGLLRNTRITNNDVLRINDLQERFYQASLAVRNDKFNQAPLELLRNLSGGSYRN
jgi:ATP phosphoribosyltransferase